MTEVAPEQKMTDKVKKLFIGKGINRGVASYHMPNLDNLDESLCHKRIVIGDPPKYGPWCGRCAHIYYNF